MPVTRPAVQWRSIRQKQAIREQPLRNKAKTMLAGRLWESRAGLGGTH